MLWSSLTEWIKKNKPLCYSIAAVFFLLINGLFLFGAISGSGSTLLLTGIVILLWCIVCLLYFRWRKKESCTDRIFILALLVLGLMYSAIFPPNTVPDELYHFESSYKYSDYIMFKNPSDESMLIREDDKALIERHTVYLSYSSYISIVDNTEVFSSNPKETSMKPIVPITLDSNPPQLKLPSALAISFARLLILGSYPLFYLGRFFNFLFFVILAFLAIKITPVGKNVFMAVSLLPMTLHVTSSYSYDAGIIGLSFLFIALCLKAIYTFELLKKRDFVAIVAVAFLLAPCKIIYSLLIFLVLLIPAKAFSSKQNSIFFKCGVIALSAFSVFVLKLSTVLHVAGLDASTSTSFDMRSGIPGHFHTLGEFFTNPIETILVFLRTLNQTGDTYFSSTIGGNLGYFQSEIAAPWYVVLAFVFFLILAFLKTPNDSFTIPSKHRAIYFVITCLGLFAVMLSMFVGNTFQEEPTIVGVQGRYLLPFLPVLALALRSNVITSERNLHILLIFGMLFLNFAYLVRIFAYATLYVG